VVASGARSPAAARDDEEVAGEDWRKKSVKVLVAVLGLTFLLGPIIVDAVRALLGMLGDH
jgi:hypothetical protein